MAVEDVDTKLVAADVTLIFAYSFARTLFTILASPDFEGWLAPVRSDPVRLEATVGFASSWAVAWLACGLALGSFARGVDDASTARVGTRGALNCFAAAAICWFALALGLPSEVEPVSRALGVVFSADSATAAVGLGGCLVLWRRVLADRSGNGWWW